MALVTAPPATADRLADAALMLLDSARGAVSEHEAKGGKLEIRELQVAAIAVQTLLAADQWPAGGLAASPAGIEVMPTVLTEKLSGAAMGIGLVIGQLPDPSIRAMLSLLVGTSLQHGIERSIERAAKSGHPG